MPYYVSESRRALKIAKELLVKLADGEEALDEKDILQLRHLEQITALVAKLVPLVKIQEPGLGRKQAAVNPVDDKALLEDFIERKISERFGGDKLNNPE